jgi:hypothetical protein
LSCPHMTIATNESFSWSTNRRLSGQVGLFGVLPTKTAGPELAGWLPTGPNSARDSGMIQAPELIRAQNRPGFLSHLHSAPVRTLYSVNAVWEPYLFIQHLRL